jgi:hypothetical protein
MRVSRPSVRLVDGDPVGFSEAHLIARIAMHPRPKLAGTKKRRTAHAPLGERGTLNGTSAVTIVKLDAPAGYPSAGVPSRTSRPAQAA